jgi:peroxin-14
LVCNRHSASPQYLLQTSDTRCHDLTDTVHSIIGIAFLQLLLSEQQQHIQLLTTQVTGLQTALAQNTGDQSLRQLKEEMSSLKGIMLSRHQFPPTPTRGGVANGGGIPAWQRASDSSGTTPTKTLEEQPSVDGDLARTAEGNEDETVLQNGNGTLHVAEGLLQETSAS